MVSKDYQVPAKFQRALFCSCLRNFRKFSRAHPRIKVFSCRIKVVKYRLTPQVESGLRIPMLKYLQTVSRQSNVFHETNSQRTSNLKASSLLLFSLPNIKSALCSPVDFFQNARCRAREVILIKARSWK